MNGQRLVHQIIISSEQSTDFSFQSSTCFLNPISEDEHMLIKYTTIVAVSSKKLIDLSWLLQLKRICYKDI
ncbi:hypothetical protein MTR_7g116365 [Medicago truncatula]|uniref:Uncharacterized protein n=1 Tax=Medicago truncatula TaxID=3880 RepID=A0A072U4D8_MEDTR|nr:hypothetical protein MTR_7g116365 [Medicago truncatula]